MTAAHPVVLVAHGTRSPIGRARVRELVDGVRMLAPQRRVLLAHVDVEEPRVGDLLAHEGIARMSCPSSRQQASTSVRTSSMRPATSTAPGCWSISGCAR